MIKNLLPLIFKRSTLKKEIFQVNKNIGIFQKCSFNFCSNEYEGVGKDFVRRLRERKDFSEPSIPVEDYKGLQTMQKNIQQYVYNGNFEEALKLTQIYADKIEKYYGDTHPAYFSAMNNQALILKRVGNFTESQEIYETVYTGYKELFGPQHNSTLTVQLNLAKLKAELGMYQSALKEFQVILSYRIGLHFMELKGEEDIEEFQKYTNLSLDEIETIQNNDIPLCLIPMSSCYREIKEFEKAITLCETAIKLLRTRYSEQNVIIANVYNNMGMTYKKQKDLKKAEEFYLKSLEIRKSLLPEEHPEVIASQHNLGELYLAMGETEKGQEYLQSNVQKMKIQEEKRQSQQQ